MNYRTDFQWETVLSIFKPSPSLKEADLLSFQITRKTAFSGIHLSRVLIKMINICTLCLMVKQDHVLMICMLADQTDGPSLYGRKLKRKTKQSYVKQAYLLKIRTLVIRFIELNIQ